MKKVILAGSVLIMTVLSLAQSAAPVKTVPAVDLNRYTGTWYEIAKYPTRFQKNCFASTATYSLQADGTIKVVNACRKDGLNGPEKGITGKAWVDVPGDNARLKVQFFWPFSAPYWIIDLGVDYDYAVVGHPERKYLWILYRKPVMDAALYKKIVAGIAAQGYDVGRIERTEQRP